VRDEARRWVFLRAGDQRGMVVLQADKGDWPAQHVAFTVRPADIEDALSTLAKHGVALRGPVFHAWMPARSIYFSDPDGHGLELCTPGQDG
jgi:lactoylglutathione lyase